MRAKNWLLIIVPLGLLLTLVGWRLSQKNQQEQQFSGGPSAGAGAPKGGGASGRPAGGPGGPGAGGGPPAVQVALASPKTITTSIEAVGSAESPFRVEISPKASGRIEYLSVREGDHVRKGAVLLKIDPSELQAAVLQQQANVAETRSRLAQAQLSQGPTEVGVTSQIQQQRAGLASTRAEYTQIERNYESQLAAAAAAVSDAASRVTGAKAQVKNAQAEVDRQLANLKNTQTRFDRIESLYRQNFIAAQEVDDARTALEVQKQTVEVARGQLEAANASLSSANAQLKSAQSQEAIAKRKGLSDIAAAKARVDQAQAGVNVANANRAQSPAYRQNLAALESNVRAAEAQLQQARVRLADSAVRSPIDGVVTSRTADPGAMASPGAPVLVVQQLDWLYVTASVPLADAGLAVVNKMVEVKFDGIDDRTFIGPISHVNPAADPQTRKISFRVKLQNDNQLLKPGMFGRVLIPVRKVSAPVTVPREAVKVDNGRATVVVIDAENKANIREVQVGAQDAKFSEIKSGIDLGEKVVTLTYRPLREGQEVRLPGAGAGGSDRGGVAPPRGSRS